MTHPKGRLRGRISNNLSAEEKNKKDSEIRERLFDIRKFKGSENFFIYISTEKEVDTHPIINELLKRGKNVFVPHIQKEKRVMVPVQIRDYPEELEKGPFGIMQPKKGSSNSVQPGKIDISIVPGVAFDESGNRVGHGFGYYDRFLRDLDSKTIALAYEFQVVEDIKCDPWDVPVDIIITEEREINC